jgi:hypothetical protein
MQHIAIYNIYVYLLYDHPFPLLHSETDALIHHVRFKNESNVTIATYIVAISFITNECVVHYFIAELLKY